MDYSGRIEELLKELNNFSPKEVISWANNTFKEGLVFASSFGAEDQVITDIILEVNPEIRIVTLDTGRLFPETYQLISKTQMHYAKSIEVFFPNYVQVEEMVAKYGINLFYDSVENRKLCCHVRKIEPLKRALMGAKAWICGLRKDQSVTRLSSSVVEWDTANNILKINPLIDWSEEQIWEYIRKKGVPYNKLHDTGFPSIGCQPCTRAIAKGEDIRSGRWWWENPEHKECGLHRK